jgi:hypothetical protein
MRSPFQFRPPQRSSSPHFQRRLRYGAAIGVALLLVWSLLLGFGLAQASEPRHATTIAQSIQIDNNLPASQVTLPAPSSEVDIVPPQYQLGQELYLENCATCHIALPPQVFPSETWRDILRDTQHYGVRIPLIQDPGRVIVWNYLRTFSRPLLPDEEAPALLWQSRYFKALHPKVDLPSRFGIESCASCHPGASRSDFRSLTPEWQDAP